MPYDAVVSDARAATRRRFPVGGIAFPIVVFAVWRVAQLAVTVAAGGDAVDSAFQWDGGAYERIMTSGFKVNPGEVRPVTAFFPLISWLAKIPDLAMGRDAAMVLTANLVALGAFISVWGAAKAWRDERLGRASVVLLALWPASLFYWAFYSEALFVLTSAAAVWADRRGRRVLAAVFLAAAAMTRSVGVVVGAMLVIVRIWRQRRIDVTAVLYGAASIAGLAVVMYGQHRQAGDALAFVHAQKEWGRSFTFPWTTLREGIGALKSGTPRLVKWLDLVGIVAMGLAVVWAVFPRSRRARRSGLPAEAWILTVALLAFPLCSGLLSSMNRFVAAAWSGFVLLAAWLGTAGPRVRAVVYGVLAIASVLFARYWADGAFVG